MIFLIATQNKHKKTEFSRILAPLGIEIKTAGELGLQYPDVEETGTTFEENALIKARAGCMLAGVPTLADDSGLCVDALDGAPGLYSARWSGDGETNGDDEANNDKLLRLLADVPDEQRTAHYVAASGTATAASATTRCSSSPLPAPSPTNRPQRVSSPRPSAKSRRRSRTASPTAAAACKTCMTS